MEQNTLQDIIEIENEIKEMLESERARADRWLVMNKSAIEKNAQETIAKLALEVDKAKSEARTNAEEKAAERVQNASCLADNLKSMREEDLKRIVWEHIRCIAPGKVHDHQDVQS